ncbi:phosphopantetheine-binding protein [Cupriavidus sp. H39]|uniref:phosphopantetheine-binding protein n=1 Tax=Cupriavidus sp. H39 TaxID=3401635 RepID=UPI003D019EF9
MQALEQEIKELIVSSLSLEDLAPGDIDTDAPLFVEGLGLDSIDALELGLALQKRFGVSMGGDKDVVRSRFASVAALAAFVSAQRADQAAA